MLLVCFWCFTVYLSVRFGYTVSTLWLIIVRKLRFTKIKTGSGVPRWWGCSRVPPSSQLIVQSVIKVANNCGDY
jgi:hypothetical protein